MSYPLRENYFNFQNNLNEIKSWASNEFYSSNYQLPFMNIHKSFIKIGIQRKSTFSSIKAPGCLIRTSYARLHQHILNIAEF